MSRLKLCLELADLGVWVCWLGSVCTHKGVPYFSERLFANRKPVV